MVSPEHRFAEGDPKQVFHPFFPLTFPLRNQTSEPQEPRGHDGGGQGCYVPMAGPVFTVLTFYTFTNP